MRIRQQTKKKLLLDKGVEAKVFNGYVKDMNVGVVVLIGEPTSNGDAVLTGPLFQVRMKR